MLQNTIEYKNCKFDAVNAYRKKHKHKPLQKPTLATRAQQDFVVACLNAQVVGDFCFLMVE
jgi:hypothetical protein